MNEYKTIEPATQSAERVKPVQERAPLGRRDGWVTMKRWSWSTVRDGGIALKSAAQYESIMTRDVNRADG